MEFRILGPLEVLDGDRPVEVAGVKQRTLLALLLLRANEVVRSERLIEEVWGEQPPANAAAALQNHISRMRKALGPEIIVSREWGYALRTEPESIDLRVFQQLVADSDPLPAHERSQRLGRALERWRGPPLSDLALEPALQRDIARLEELHVSTIERRIDADLEAGRDTELIAELETLVAEHPLREHARSQLILALYRAGRQAEALEVYRETRRVLAEELGLDPSPELRELEKAILRQDPSLAAPPNLPPAPAGSRSGTALPPASKRRRWLVGGIAGALLVGLGGGSVVALLTGALSSDPMTSTVALPQSTGGVASGPRKLFTISDAYSGNEIDNRTWYEFYEGNNWTISERGGHLEFRFPPSTTASGTYNDFGGHVGTLCEFPGDFDAHVKFDLVSWPPANGVTVTLFSFLGSESLFFQSSRASGAAGESYSSYTGYWSNFTGDDTAGALRVARRNGVVTTYFLQDGRWKVMRSARNIEYAKLAVGALGFTTSGFGGRPVVVDFTNFSVTAANPICPPNANRPTG